MALITQGIDKTSDPSYMGLSQGTDRAKANTAKGDWLTNMAQTGGAAIKAAHDLQSNLLEAKVDAGVESLWNNMGLNDAANASQAGVPPTAVQGESGSLLESPLKAGQGNPAGLQRYGQRLESLEAKYRNGELSESYYNAKLLSLTKGIKSQHSGWNSEVDALIRNKTGINPANALVKSLRADFDTAERARTAALSKDDTYLNAHIQYMTPATREKIIKGDRSPETVALAKWESSSLQARAYQVQQANNDLELKLKQGKFDETETKHVAQLTVTEYANNAYRDMNSVSGGADGIVQKIKAQGDKPWTPDEDKAMRASFANFRAQTVGGVHQILSQPQYAKLPESEKKAIIAGVEERIAVTEKALIDKDFGTLGMQARHTEAIQNNDVARILATNEYARKAAALSKIGGAGAAELLKTTLTSQEGMHVYVKSMNDLNRMNLILGEGGSLLDQTKVVKDASRTVPELKDPAGHKAHIDGAVKGLVGAKDITIAENHAKAMFGQGNVGFLEHFDKGSQQQVFRALTLPSVDRKMVEIGGELYKNYRDWVVSYGFQSQSKRVLDTVMDAKTNPSGQFDINYDPATYTFKATPRPEAAALTSYTDRGRLDQAQKYMDGVVGQLNENLRIIAPILKREGGDPTEAIGQVLKANGWDPNKPMQDTFLGSIGKAVGKWWSGSGDASATQGAQGIEYRMDKAPGGSQGGSTDSGRDDSGAINLDPSKLEVIGTRSAGLKEVILKAESGGNFDAVYGTSRKIPITKMTVNEVLDLQGQMQKAGAASTAVGGFQFLRKTLTGLKQELGLTGDEVMNKDLQHRLADALLQRRGYGEYLEGRMGHKQFVDEVAKEWAGLPNTKGKSHYDGDGLNKSNVPLRSILDELKKVRSEG